MQKCPRCAKAYADEAKICRVCGSILDALTAPAAVSLSVPDREPAPASHEALPEEPELLSLADALENDSGNSNSTATSGDQPAWLCPKCGKSVPGNFDICWNCFTTRDGTFDPEFAEFAAADIAEDQEDDEAELLTQEDAEETEFDDHGERASTQRENSSCCPRCGSDKIIRDARLRDQGEYSDGTGYIMVYGDPEAMIFKKTRFGKLSADICGQCGHVEFRVENPAELYEHYLKSRQ
jgi:hypothetical protein